MRELDLGGLRARVAGGEGGSGSGEGPIVVLMHGFGAPGDDLVSLWRVIDAPRGTRFVFPEAPIELGGPFGGGRAWWHIDMMELQMAMLRGRRDVLRESEPKGLTEAREAVLSMLAAIPAELGAPAGGHGITLGGFSQGSMLALDVALRSEVDLAGLVLLSSTLLAEKVWRPLMPKRSGLRAVQSHGSEDPLLPFATAEVLRDALREAGWQIDWVPFRGGHGVPPEAIDAIGRQLRGAQGR